MRGSVVRISIVGKGKMGKQVSCVARELGHRVVAEVGMGEDRHSLRKGEVILDFATAKDPFAHFSSLFDCGLPVVIGSTNWDESTCSLKKLAKAKGVSILVGSNFSIGVALLRSFAMQASKVLKKVGGFELAGIETHHREKKDTPSGTAREIMKELQSREGLSLSSFASLRLGSIVGEHTLLFHSNEERLELCHRAIDRRAFARGAIFAAKWLIGKEGIFTVDDWIDDQFLKE